MKIENPRTDIATRKPFPKEKLLRLVYVGGALLIDKKGDMKGRGMYLLKEDSSLELALRKHVFERFLHRALKEEELEAIKEAIHE